MSLDRFVNRLADRVRQIGHPQCSLKIGPRNVEWVNVSKTWYGRSNVQSCRVLLPPELIRVSPTDPNIIDREALLELLQPIVQKQRHVRRDSPIVLVLPDRSVRVSLLELRVVPAKTAELHRLVRWRLEKEALFPMAGSTLKTVIIDGKSVLAVTIRDSVLQQYEALCQALGFQAVEVDITSFRLCNMFASLLGVDTPTMWVSLLDGGMSVIIFEDHRPVFFRSKVQWTYHPENIISDLRQSIAYYAVSSHSALSVQRLVLMTENGSADLADRIASELNIPTIDARTQCSDHKGTENVAALAGILGW